MGGLIAATFNPNGTTSNLKVTELNGGPLAGFRNRIINRGFDVWQRGTSFVSPTNTFMADRWLAYSVNPGITYSRTARAVGSGGTYYLRGAATSGANTVGLIQPLEDIEVNKLIGQTITISFYGVISSGTHTFYMQCLKGSAANTWTSGLTAISGLATCVFTTTPKRFSLTVAIPTDGTANTIAPYIQALNVQNGFSFGIYDVQLEIGSVATPFEARPIGVELELCRRYYEVIGDGLNRTRVVAGSMYTNSVFHASLFYKTTKRTFPTVSVKTGAATDFRVLIGGGAYSISALSFFDMNINHCFVTANTSAGTMGYGGLIESNDNAYPTIQISAEL